MRAVLLAPRESRSKASVAVADALAGRGFAVDLRSRSPEGRPDVVICWGRPASPSRAAVVINPVGAVRTAGSKERTSLLLHLHGIPVDPESLPREAVRPVAPPATSAYLPVRAHVADLRVLALEDEQGAMRAVSRWRSERILEGACRAVYLLGLHFGAVDLAVHPSGRWFVAGVDPHPAVGDELASAYGEAIAGMAESWSGGPGPAGTAVLGADPEFALVTSSGKLVYASRYVNHLGLVGYDRQSRANRGSVFPLAELRPEPSPSPRTLASNVRSALLAATGLLPTRGVHWLAGSFPYGSYPTGGHVHISGVELTTPLLQALDNYLGVPVMLVEQRERAKRRRRRYGRAGDFRRKEHGGFEYRVLPSWIVSPEATQATLCLAKVVATEWPRLWRNHLSSVRAVKEFYMSRKGRFRDLFPRLFRAVLSTDAGLEYRRELAYFSQMIDAKDEWQEDRDLKAAWRL